MDMNSLICEGFGLQDLVIERHQFSEEHQKLVIWANLGFDKARCSVCRNSFYSFHQWQHRSLRLPPFGVSKAVYIQLRYPRGSCYFCEKVTPASLTFVHPKFGGLSCSFVETAGRMMEEMTCAAVSRLLKIDRKLLWKIDQWRMQYMKQLCELPKDLDCSKMSADEVHFITKRYKYKNSPFAPKYYVEYVTNLVCTKHSKVISNALGRSYNSLIKCLNVLSEEKLKEVCFFSVDMHKEFFNAIKKKCPEAEIAVDRYHLVESLNKVFNRLRQSEYEKAKRKQDPFQTDMLEPGRKFILSKRNPVLSIEEKNMLGKLKMLNTNINAGMLIVDYFHKVLDQKGVGKFRKRLRQWYQLVRESKLKIFNKFALQVKKYRKNIEAYIRSRLTTAVSEGLNNKIKVLKRMGYNYTNEKSFQNKILQRCGFLNSTHINTNFLFWHVPYPQI